MAAGVLASQQLTLNGRATAAVSVSSGYDNNATDSQGRAPRRYNKVEGSPLVRVPVGDTGRFTTQSIGGPAAPSPALNPQAPFVPMATSTATLITADGVLTTANTANWFL